MESKCEFCKYDNIDHISCFSLPIDICLKCEYIRVPFIMYHEFIKAYMIDSNFYDLKKYIDELEIPVNNRKIYNKFINYTYISNFKNKKLSNEYCNFCGEKLNIIENKTFKKFNMYYCSYCESLYFKKNDFIEMCEYLKKRTINSCRWFGFIYKLIEIFQ